ncbi:MAG TPA: low affinity iron permease family protein [Ferruginibacter sp.]|nr:low affinity iron permease family protein [Ferruginibacter sp.]
MQKKTGLKTRFNNFSSWVAKVTGSPRAFFIALMVVIAWGATGPLFKFSETWQLVINTGTTIVTFLMMFIIQQSQNKDTMALHLKLNELLAANELTSNRLVASEDLTEEELEVIKKYYKRLSMISQKKQSLFSTHSFDEATQQAEKKILQSTKQTKIVNPKNKKK